MRKLLMLVFVAVFALLTAAPAFAQSENAKSNPFPYERGTCGISSGHVGYQAGNSGRTTAVGEHTGTSSMPASQIYQADDPEARAVGSACDRTAQDEF